MKGLTKTITVIALKTAGVVVAVFFFVVAIFSVLFPKVAIKYYDFFGSKKAIVCEWELVYSRSSEISDLYNLIQCSVEACDHEATSEYVLKMLKDENFSVFSHEINKISEENSTIYSKYLTCDYESFLFSALVNAEYHKSGTTETFNTAVQCLNPENSNYFRFEFGSLIENIISDEVKTDIEKKDELSRILNKTTYNSTVSELMKNWIDVRLQNNIVSSLNKEQEIICKQLKLRALATYCTLLSVNGGSEYDSRVVEYNNLSNEIKANIGNL